MQYLFDIFGSGKLTVKVWQLHDLLKATAMATCKVLEKFTFIIKCHQMLLLWFAAPEIKHLGLFDDLGLTPNNQLSESLSPRLMKE